MADCLVELSERDDVKIEITFDDGNVSDVEFALPALVERELVASFYVCAGRLGQPGYLALDDLQTLRDADMTIGSHGWDHRDLRTVPDAEMPREASESRRFISEGIGAAVDSFAIPFGSYNRRVLRHLREYGTVMTSDRTPAPATGWLLPRYSFVHGWGPAQARSLVDRNISATDRYRRHAVLLYKRLR